MRLASPIAAIAVAALITGLPALVPVASANGAFGASLGAEKDEGVEEAPSGEAGRTLGVWGRLELGLGGRLSGQLELQGTTSAEAYLTTTLRSATALIVLDLLEWHHLVPTLLIGGGLGRVSFYGGTEQRRTAHFEAGLGLEYRTSGGFCFGADVRLGDRSIDDDPRISGAGIVAGSYRSMRLMAGVRF
jgi:hypothetical protein